MSRGSWSLPLLALCWVLSPFGGWGEETAPNSSDYETQRQRLVELSTRLSVLNERLQGELRTSKAAYETLRQTLLTSQDDSRLLSEQVASLQSELADLMQRSEALSQQATESAQASTRLSVSLRSAEASLESLGQSLAVSRREARRLARTRSVLVVLAVLGTAAGVVVGLAF